MQWQWWRRREYPARARTVKKEILAKTEEKVE